MSQPIESPLTERPSNVRYGVLAFLCVLTLILYLDRLCIGQALTNIKKEWKLQNDDMTWVLMAFTLSYALFEVPMGWWGDKYGSRGVLTRIVLWWSAFTALTGAALGLPSLIVIRFLFGAGEAGALPNSACILARWFPIERRGMAQGALNASMQIGGAVAPIVTAGLIQVVGWRWAFAALSIPGVLWAITFWWWFRDEPQTHSAVNEAERQLILVGTVRRSGEHPKIPWRAVLTHPQVWLLGFILSCSAFNSYLYFFWYPTYLKEARGCGDIEAGWLSSLVLAGGAIGCMSGGFIIDWLTRRTGDRFWCRRRLSFLAMSLAAVLLLIGKLCDSSLIASLWTAGSFLLAVMTLASWWGAVADLSGPHLGALFGLMNSLGGFGGMASQRFAGKFAVWMEEHGFTGRAQWDPMFYVYALVIFVGALAWMFIDTRRSVEDSRAARG
ncbi:MAG: MFS transporter [Planctomycetaceae bacterium]